jgi:hypothetical protein
MCGLQQRYLSSSNVGILFVRVDHGVTHVVGLFDWTD